MLKNFKIAVKAIVPLILMAVVAAGLVFYSTASLDRLAAQTRTIVDVQAVRLEGILSVRMLVDEAAVQARNIILETREREAAEYKARYAAAGKASLDAVDKLLAMSDAPERVAANRTLQAVLRDFFAIVDRSTALGLANDGGAATRVLLGEATVARAKLRHIVQGRIDALTAELRQARDDAERDVATARTVLIVAATAGLFAAVALAVLIVTSGITRPIGRLVTVLERMAQGAIEAEIKEAARGDEIGAVGRAVDGIKAMVARKAAEEAEVRRRTDEAALAERKRTMIELADGFERAVGGIVGQVSSAATELQATAQQMTSTASETAAQSTAVAAAAEEAASNVGTVAAAAEELGASVQEIGRQVQGSTTLAQRAMDEADQAAHLVQELNGAVGRIGDVVGMISNIASQTNLLALNATIEAARAGEAGRGFAVVATEVKELAGQTARATGEIADQIGKVQAATSHAVAAIGSITGQIREINVVATTIAAAVEEQGAATQEIVRNVAQAAAGTGEVTGNIAGVAQASEDTGAAATQVLASSSELARQSEHLTAEVSRFLSTVRAA